MDAQRYRRVEKLEERIGYRFEDRALAMRAMRHSSYGDGQGSEPNNERLEFLGDRVLGLMTAHALFDHSGEAEGTLARRLNALVRKEMCAKVARKIGLGQAVMISPSEDKHGGRDKTSILGDACEALIAALYLDGGLAAAQAFYDRFWMSELDDVSSRSAKDPKTLLQELAMSRACGLPDYTVVERSGPDHDPVFSVEVAVTGAGSARGEGKNKREAERLAAQALIDIWQ
ncbi:ribonuclease III [uncultured Algimonas sp.]|uniref:ribonuclease III n=1 Tax=uncultured Algimonas sp. TaxID=1547920 RepID=UPI00344B64AE